MPYKDKAYGKLQARLFSKAQRMQRVLEGCCMYCGKRQPREGKKTCQECYERAKLRDAATDKELRRTYQANWKLKAEASGKKFKISRDCHLKKKYGITEAQYKEMVFWQHGLCAVCQSVPAVTNHPGKARLHVDHCHITGKVRGLLCSKCNLAIGAMKDSSGLLMRAARYIATYAREHGQQIAFADEVVTP